MGAGCERGGSAGSVRIFFDQSWVLQVSARRRRSMVSSPFRFSAHFASADSCSFFALHVLLTEEAEPRSLRSFLQPW